MSKKIKYRLSWLITVFACLGILDEVLHDFTESKWLYATFNSDTYFEKDVILYEGQTSGGSRSKGLDIYYYHGTLKKNKEIKRVLYDEDSMNKLWSPELEIPVWYCNINGSVAIRTTENPPSPYSFDLLKAYINILTWILILPALFYIINYTIQKRKTKSSKTQPNEN